MLLETLHAALPKPAALIYMRATPNTVLERVRQRRHPFEQDMPLDYLQDLRRHYDNWAADYRDARLLRLDSDAQDYREGADRVNRVVAQLTPWLLEK